MIKKFKQNKLHFGLNLTLCLIVIAVIYYNRPTVFYIDQFKNPAYNNETQFRICAEFHKWGTNTICPGGGANLYAPVQQQLYNVQGKFSSMSFVQRWKTTF